MKTIISKFYSIDEDQKLLYLNKVLICELPKDENLKKEILIKEGVLLRCTQFKKFDESVLVLEPHPDDFALSALAYTIGRYNANVLNIFTKTTLKYFPWMNKIELSAIEYEKIRLEESSMVVKSMLNQKFKSLKEKSMRITKKKNQLIESEIFNAVNNELECDKALLTLMVPMGVGEHPDHLIIYNTIMNNYDKFKNYKILLYPEYPYSRCKKKYYDRMKFINDHYIVKPIIVNIEDYLDNIVDCISAYKSQFDDINRNQMLAIVREDSWAIAQDYNSDKLSYVFYEVMGVK